MRVTRAPQVFLAPPLHRACSRLPAARVGSEASSRPRSNRRRRSESEQSVVVAAVSPSSPSTSTPSPLPRSADVVIVGSGIGGLCAAALLARYGFSVVVVEAHDRPGGAAHSFSVGAPGTRGETFEFDAGPSFFAGLGGPLGDKTSNPLKQVLNAIGEEVECVDYDRWTTHVGSSPRSLSTPTTSAPFASSSPFDVVADGDGFAEMVLRQGGPVAHQQWLRLEREMRPLQLGASSFPAAALRGDVGVVLSCARFGPSMLGAGLVASKLTAPFSRLIESAGVTDPWLLSWLDLECFVLSGMTAKDTICAEMAYMFYERNRRRGGESGSRLPFDYPLGGGSRAIVDALVRGLEKHGGRIFFNHRVEEIVVDGTGRATGVRVKSVRGGKSSSDSALVSAKEAVVSNASAWDTARLLPRDARGRAGSSVEKLRSSAGETPALPSFMHLHLGVDATGLPPGGAKEAHHLFVHELFQEKIDEPQNVCILSIPTVFDRSLAPRPGGEVKGSTSDPPSPSQYATVHAYTAGNEPYELWEGIERSSREYKELKEERTRVLWRCVERVIPDARERAVVSLSGSPRTHERFLNRHRGSYGPGISAAESSFPGPKTGVSGLIRVGDSCAPGIGVPAAAASGMIAANTLAGVWDHLRLLDSLGL